MRLLAAFLFSTLLTQFAVAQEAEEAAVLAVAQQIMDGINQKDGDLIRSAMIPEGVLFSTVNRNGVDQAFFSSAEDFASQVSDATDDYHERLFDATVLVQKGVALVWAPYDFHLNGEFTHCGVDTVSLVKTDEGWKAVSLTYTVETEGCPERPPIPSSDDQ